jgi:hypothetical protein
MQKEEKRGEAGGKSKLEEYEGMPQHQHYPPAKRCEDRNPNYSEEQQQDVA